jgi:hypothetical protein
MNNATDEKEETRDHQNPPLSSFSQSSKIALKIVPTEGMKRVIAFAGR